MQAYMPTTVAGGSRRRYRLLIVDDDQGLRENLSELFLAVGYDVATASNTGEALAALASSTVDLLLTDYKMPGPSGVELIDAARKAHPGLCAILMTAFGDTSPEVEKARGGAVGYISKPFEADEVVRLVDRILTNGGS